jgi:hypothetical protein
VVLELALVVLVYPCALHDFIILAQ